MQPKSKSNKKNNLSKKPVNIWIFTALTLLLPAVAVGQVLLAPRSLGQAVATVTLVPLLVICVAILGITYSFLRARGRPAYTMIALVLPVAYFGWTSLILAGNYIWQASPDYKQYQKYSYMCDNLYSYKNQLTERIDEKAEFTKSINIDPNLINRDLETAYNYASGIWLSSSPCGDTHMSGDELDELKAHYESTSKAIDDLKDYTAVYENFVAVSVLEDVFRREQAGYVDEAISHAKEKGISWQGEKMCSPQGVCSIKWTRHLYLKDQTTSSTQELLQSYRDAIATYRT